MQRRLIPHVTALLVLFAALAADALAQRRQPRQALPDNLIVEKDVNYGRAGERQLRLDVIRPKEESKEPRPAVVWIHGGGWKAGSKDGGARRLLPLLRGADYVGFSVGYRLSGEATWPAQIHDCKAAIRWIRANAKKYNIDPEKIGVWGSSAGGHLVSLLGTSGGVKELEGENGSADASSRVACVVDYCGPSDFLAFVEAKPSANAQSAISGLFGGAVKDQAEPARLASPVTHVSKDDPPFLVVHGTNDRTVPLSQADLFAEALNKAGVDVTYVKLEGGGHGIGGTEITARVKTFFDKHLLEKEVKVSAEPIKAAPRRD